MNCRLPRFLGLIGEDCHPRREGALYVTDGRSHTVSACADKVHLDKVMGQFGAGDTGFVPRKPV
jgi:hypothetical protein